MCALWEKLGYGADLIATISIFYKEQFNATSSLDEGHRESLLIQHNSTVFHCKTKVEKSDHGGQG